MPPTLLEWSVRHDDHDRFAIAPRPPAALVWIALAVSVLLSVIVLAG